MSGNRGNRLRFSKDEDDKLINAVSRSPALYDVKHKHYHDHTARDEAWEEIAKNIGKRVVDCKIRWKSLKDVYRKRKKEIADASFKKPCKWEHMDALQFLEGVVFSRSQPRKPTDQDQNTHDRPEFISVEADEETKDDHPDVKVEVEDTDLESDNLVSDDMEHHSNQMAVAAMHHSEGRHPIQLFFDSMARTVMDFPPPLAVRTKLEVLQVISKAELEMWEQSGSQRRPSKY